MTADDLQHVTVKVAAGTQVLDLATVVPVFHRWIQEAADSQMLIDVADYRHVDSGPGVVLVGYAALYSLDTFGGRLGLTYTQRSAVTGAPVQRVSDALRAAVDACRRLEGESSLAGLTFNPGDLEIGVNDRMLAPNTSATASVLSPVVQEALQGLFPGAAFTLKPIGEPRDLFKLRATAAGQLSLAAAQN